MKQLRTTIGIALALALAPVLAGCGSDPDDRAPAAAPTTTMTATPSANPAAPAESTGSAVWWDQDGLHRGDTVERTAIPLGDGDTSVAYLALVRSGALYRDPRNGQIWFHPWGGTPRVVGHGSVAGAGGDPEGDTAAWFDGRDLVVYDTARDKVVSRSRESVIVARRPEYVEHVGHGNGWVHVSSTQVVWRFPSNEGSDLVARRDLVTGRTEVPWNPRPASGRHDARFMDVSGTSAVWTTDGTFSGRGPYLYDRAGSTTTRRIAKLEGSGRLSPDGSWLVTAEMADGTHGVAITDLRTGKTWKPLEKDTYAFFSWAYGDVVMMNTHRGPGPDRTVFSCSATQQTCTVVKTRGPTLLPTP